MHAIRYTGICAECPRCSQVDVLILSCADRAVQSHSEGVVVVMCRGTPAATGRAHCADRAVQNPEALWVQNKELMLSKLRTELCISDERHEELRQRLDSGEERPWVRCVLRTLPSS